ncbi:hypothetical protein AAY473_000415 [Plecturocebus cupreus]
MKPRARAQKTHSDSFLSRKRGAAAYRKRLSRCVAQAALELLASSGPPRLVLSKCWDDRREPRRLAQCMEHLGGPV